MAYEPMSEEQQPESDTPHSEENSPKGAFVFVLLMGLFYVIYFTLTWLEVIGRGGA